MKTIDYRSDGEKYVPYWKKCVGAGRANEGLRASFQEHLEMLQEDVGFEYLRFHGLLHDDMFAARKNEAGQTIYNFQYIDDLFDRMLDKKIRPFVELSFFPSCMKGGDATVFWWKGNVTPPENYDEWCELIKRLVQHLIARYGKEEVCRWYFEVWNEPDLYGFWDGTRTQYFELYKATVTAIKEICPALKVGGPATSNFVPDARFDGEKEDFSCQLTHQIEDLDSLSWHGVWIREFLAYCEQEKLPVDFVSTHPYPTDFALDESGETRGRSRGIGAARADMTWLLETVRNSAYPDAEIHLTEWSSSPSARDCTHDFLQEACFIVKNNLDCIGLADSLSYWTFTDVFEEGGAGDCAFHGGFGLINYQGIPKPAFHAYRMLAALGENCLYKDDHAFFTKKDGKLSALLYHYPLTTSVCMSVYPDTAPAEKELNAGEDIVLSYRITGLQPDTAFTLETLDKTHGSVFPVWQEMGSPASPTKEEIRRLKEAAGRTDISSVRSDSEGNLELWLTVSPWTVCLITEC